MARDYEVCNSTEGHLDIKRMQFWQLMLIQVLSLAVEIIISSPGQKSAC